MYFTYPRNSGPISIDGKFDDWSDVMKFGMFQNSAEDRTNVTEWAVESGEGQVYVYVSTVSSPMSTSEIDSFLAFIDSDGDSATGYSMSGIGADYLIQVNGWNGSVSSSVLSRFAFTSDRLDWNGWQDMGSVGVRLAANRMEASASISSLDRETTYVLVARSGQTAQGISYPIHEDTPVLIVRQEPIGAIQNTGIILKSSSTPAMHLILSCQGGLGSVTAIQPSVSGAIDMPIQIGSTALSPGGQPQELTVNLDTSSSSSGSFVSLSVPESGVTTTFESVVVAGGPLKAYVASAPSSIQIDGAFGDWVGRTSPDTDPADVKDENIDISAVGAVNTTASSSFYVSVVGEVCGGSFVPSDITKPSGSGGGTVVPAKKSGEDTLRVYIDTDMSSSTGEVIIHPSKTIGADFLIEITGLNGQILSKSLSEFVSGSWNFVPGTISAANDAQQIEIGVASSSISGAQSIEFVIETTDWREWSDLATAVPMGTRSTSGPDFGTRAWIVDSTIASAAATATSNQRKLFFDDTNFWSVYVDGPDTIARYSGDGVNWASDGRIFKTAGVVRASVWYDATSHLVYVVGDRGASSVNVYVQRGSVSPSTQTITWTTADRVLPVSSIGVGSKNTYIAKDAAGYLWVMATNCTGVTPTRYDLSIFRSTNPDSVTGTWALTGSMQIGIVQSTSKGVLAPAGTGTDMWAVYTYSGTIACRKYTGVWGAESILYAPSGAGSNTEDAPPSALVDARGVLHIVYGDDHEQPAGTSRPHIFYRYYTGSSWSAAVALSSISNILGFRYPTISLDAGTGNLYAFWYDIQTQYVVAKRNISGTWSALALNSQTADVKQYLTSIYSAPSMAYICYQWTQNTTAPIHVVFDRIPEFSDAALPVVGMMAILVLILSPIRKRREKN